MIKNNHVNKTAGSDPENPTDAFGNTIGPEVGYARGSILISSLEETRRFRHCQEIAVRRIHQNGVDSIGVFTGSRRAFPILHGDQETICEEWLGPSLHEQTVKEAALAHLGGQPSHDIAFFNRTSAGIIAAINALGSGRPVVSVVPESGRSHTSVIRGCAVAGIPLIETQECHDWSSVITRCKPKLIIITTVTSKLDIVSESAIGQIIESGHKMDAWVMLDEAYGARLRPALLGGRPSLAFDADLTITNCDKSGMRGPRAGLMAGRPALIGRVQARAFELGMEARAPIIAAAFRALQHYRPEHLVAEAANGHALTDALSAALPSLHVKRSALGPLLSEDNILAQMLHIAKPASASGLIVPCEATTALGVLLLRDYGILTTNTHGQPGASVTLRLKPTHGALERVGGITGVIDALRLSIDAAAQLLDKPAQLRTLFFGPS